MLVNDLRHAVIVGKPGPCIPHGGAHACESCRSDEQACSLDAVVAPHAKYNGAALSTHQGYN
eukprot:945307-Pelagomonas_calceolata.AAC.3